MSGTLRTSVVVMASMLALSTSSCSEDAVKSSPEPEYIKVCVIDGYYFADVTESEAERNAELYSEDMQPCHKADTKAAEQRKQQARKDKLQVQRERERTSGALQAATGKASTRTGKLFAVINLACRDEGIWQYHVYNVYERAYSQHWYPSQAVAFPYELRGALRKSCPSQVDKKTPY